MRRSLTILVLVLLASTLVHADVYSKKVVRDDTYFIGIPWKSTEIGVEEVWIGEQRAALTQEGKTYVLDLDRNTFLFISHTAGTYIEMPLPLDLTQVLSGEVRRRYETETTAGEVKETGGSADVLEKSCSEYDVVYWTPEQGHQHNLREIKVWATTELDFDWTIFDQLLENMRQIHNRDARLRRELLKIEGFQMRLELHDDGWVWDRRFVSEAVEFAVKEPPPGTYLPPADYVRKEQLTSQEL